MKPPDPLVVKSHWLRLGAIVEAMPILVQEGGLEDFMRFLGMLVSDGILPADEVRSLQAQAALLAGTDQQTE